MPLAQIYPLKPMLSSLDDLDRKFNARLNLLDSSFQRAVSKRSVSSRADRCYLQEGLISTLWQTWCFAVRSIIIQSVRGAATATGLITTSPHAARSEGELAFIAARLARNQPINTIQPLAGSHMEPTWGDLNKIPLIANGFGLSNGNSLATSLSSPGSVSDLQMCRNACAHLNKDRINDLKSAKIKYSDTSMNHPSDMIYWTEPNSGTMLWQLWTDEMRIVYTIACQ